MKRAFFAAAAAGFPAGSEFLPPAQFKNLEYAYTSPTRFVGSSFGEQPDRRLSIFAGPEQIC